jgi:hypothetical protein
MIFYPNPIPLINSHYAFNRRVTELTRRFAEFFLVFRSLPPAVAGDRAPKGSCFNQVNCWDFF